MPKTIPPYPGGPPQERSPAEEHRPFDFELITPMFGGGVDARVNDPTHPVRETEVRGQLEFWWRATRGSRCRSVTELRAEQTRIWGNTETHSRVRVVVDRVTADDPAPAATIDWNPRAGQNGRWQLNWRDPFRAQDGAVAYALFPFQGKVPPPNPNAQIQEHPASCIRRASFRVTISCEPQYWPEVEPAVWAWANFGGLGGRTRRGCGAIFCQALAPPSAARAGEWLRQESARFGLTTTANAPEWPLLAGLLLRPESGPAVDVWAWLIGAYRHFRQGRDFARNQGGVQPGRSRFPEPETIRRITNRRWEKHESWDEMPDGFPRAEFGLPIVFHFKDESRGEPPQTTLYPYLETPDENGRVTPQTPERMASPLILRPLTLGDRTAVPLIAQLAGVGVGRVELQDGDRNCLTPRRRVPVRHPDLAYEGSPLHGRSATGSAVDAFLYYARHENGFEEVW